MRGEGYKKTPELVEAMMKEYKPLEAPADYCIMKPVSLLSSEEQPETVFFLVNPDQLSALIVLANYDLVEMTEFSPLQFRCSSIIQLPV